MRNIFLQSSSTPSLHHSIIPFQLMLCLALTSASLSFARDKGWQSKAASGINLTSGNSDTMMLNADIGIENRGKVNEFELSALFAYGETEDDTTEKNGNTRAQYNRLMTDQAYLYLNTEAAYDEIAKLDYRITAGPGIGYYILKQDSRSLSLELGAAFIGEQIQVDNELDSTSQEETDDRIVLRTTQRFQGTISETANIWEYIEYLPEPGEWNTYLLNIEMGIETTINKRFSLRLTALNKYDSDPAPGVKENDTVIKAAFVCKLH